MVLQASIQQSERQARIQSILARRKQALQAKQAPKDPLLPRAAEVEADIQKREAPIAQPLAQLVLGSDPKPITALELIGNIGQRAEAAVANVGLELQREDGIRSVSGLIGEASKGIKGERLGKLSDLLVKTGVPAPVANATSFIAAVGASNLATGGKIASGANKVKGAIKKGARRQAVKKIRKKREFFIQKADDFSSGIDDAFSGMRQEFDDIYKLVGDAEINSEGRAVVQEVADTLPSDVLTLIKKNLKVTGKELKNNINTVKTIKTELGRKVPKRVWSGLDEATEVQAKMMQDYHRLNDVIAENAGGAREELLRLNAKFKSLHDFNRGIRPTLKKGTGVTKSNIRNIHSKAMQGDLKAMTKFSNKFFKNGLDIIDDIERFNRTEKFIKGLQKSAIGIGLGTGGAIAANQFIRKPLLEATGGGSGTGNQ